MLVSMLGIINMIRSKRLIIGLNRRLTYKTEGIKGMALELKREEYGASKLQRELGENIVSIYLEAMKEYQKHKRLSRIKVGEDEWIDACVIASNIVIGAKNDYYYFMLDYFAYDRENDRFILCIRSFYATDDENGNEVFIEQTYFYDLSDGDKNTIYAGCTTYQIAMEVCSWIFNQSKNEKYLVEVLNEKFSSVGQKVMIASLYTGKTLSVKEYGRWKVVIEKIGAGRKGFAIEGLDIYDRIRVVVEMAEIGLGVVLIDRLLLGINYLTTWSLAARIDKNGFVSHFLFVRHWRFESRDKYIKGITMRDSNSMPIKIIANATDLPVEDMDGLYCAVETFQNIEGTVRVHRLDLAYDQTKIRDFYLDLTYLPYQELSKKTPKLLKQITANVLSSLP